MERCCPGSHGDISGFWAEVSIVELIVAHTPNRLACVRALPDEEKLRVYVRIVRLLLEDEDSVQAERFYNRAALIAHSTTDKETLLSFKLCQARIMDYSRKFLEAASRYHELSWVPEIDEEERRHMLYVYLGYSPFPVRGSRLRL